MMKIILFLAPNLAAIDGSPAQSISSVRQSLSTSLYPIRMNSFWNCGISSFHSLGPHLNHGRSHFFKFIGFHEAPVLEPPNPFLASSILWMIFSLFKTKKGNTEQKNGKYLIHLTVFVRVFRSIILTDADSNALIVRLGLCCIFLRACVGSPTLSSHTLPLF